MACGYTDVFAVCITQTIKFIHHIRRQSSRNRTFQLKICTGFKTGIVHSYVDIKFFSNETNKTVTKLVR